MVNYMRALGSGAVQPASGMGGAAYDPAAQAARQAEMLAQAVKESVITQEEAEAFQTVHDAVERYRIEHPELNQSGTSATEREAGILSALVEAQIVTQEKADLFKDVHDRLETSGLMP